METLNKAQRDERIVDIIKNSSSEREKQKAFNELYSIYNKTIQTFINLKINDEEATEDLKMITFEKVYSNINSYNKKYAFSTWIYTIAKNTVIDHVRKANFEVLSIDELSVENSDESYEFQIKSDCLTPEQDMVRDQKILTIQKALDSIENKEVKRIMKLRYIQELSFEEIAEIEGVEIGCSSIRVKVLRGKKILKEILKDI
jgi:RNA polymerase sigma-70 factor (ECF subfamily)